MNLNIKDHIDKLDVNIIYIIIYQDALITLKEDLKQNRKDLSNLKD